MVKMVAETALYDLLGVAPDATDDDIKKAYRKKAMQCHPDKNPNDPEAAQKFQEMASAYDVLSDPQMRTVYDTGGLAALTPSMDDMGGMGGFNTEDLFESLFGGGGFHFDFQNGPKSGKKRGPRKGDDTVVPLDVTLEDLYNGKVVKMALEKEVVCAVCTGSGAKGKHKPKKCEKCEGKGFTFAHSQTAQKQIGVQQITCSDCEGAGVRLKEKDRCKKCKGARTVKEKSRQEIVIEKGMTDRERIVLSGEGDQQPGVPPGDVVFSLRCAPHESFQRAGADLLATVRITLSEALLGFSRVVLTHLDGRGVRVTTPRGKIVHHDDAIVVRGEGMPIRAIGPPTGKERGDLFVVFEIEMPPDEWLQGVDTKMLEKLLPPRRPEMVPRPSVVEDVRYEPTDIAAFGEGDEEGWTDDNDDDDDGEDGEYGPSECKQQ